MQVELRPGPLTWPVVEQLEELRQAQPEYEAVYIVEANSTAAAVIGNDFTHQQLYAKIHVLLIGSNRTEFQSSLLASPAKPFLASFKELYIDFTPRESHVFTSSDFYAFQALYNPDCRDLVHREVTKAVESVRPSGPLPTLLC